MNCSTTAALQNRSFLIGNFGASVFMTFYIGVYGMGIIIYFACQFTSNSRDNNDDDIPNEFFSTLNHITERQEIYNQLTNEDWVKKVYKVYYGDQSNCAQLIEQKANQCSKKYILKVQNLKSRHAYYILETSATPAISTITYSK